MWRKLHNEELNDLYCSPNFVRVNKSRRMRLAGNVACMGGKRCVYTVFWWGNLRGRDYLEYKGVDWEDNIKLDLQKVGYGGMDWFQLAQDSDRWRALANAIIPSGSIKCGEFLDWLQTG